MAQEPQHDVLHLGVHREVVGVRGQHPRQQRSEDELARLEEAALQHKESAGKVGQPFEVVGRGG